jgi:hypothetical protein
MKLNWLIHPRAKQGSIESIENNFAFHIQYSWLIINELTNYL